MVEGFSFVKRGKLSNSQFDALMKLLSLPKDALSKALRDVLVYDCDLDAACKKSGCLVENLKPLYDHCLSSLDLINKIQKRDTVTNQVAAEISYFADAYEAIDANLNKAGLVLEPHKKRAAAEALFLAYYEGEVDCINDAVKDILKCNSIK